MNILLTNATDIFAGGEDYVLILAKYLARRGHRVWVSALPNHLLLKKCDAQGTETIPIDYRGMSHVFSVARQLRAAVRHRSIDTIHSNANYDRTAAAFAASFSRVRHVAGVHSTHSIEHNITHWVRNRWLTDHFITDADAGKLVLTAMDGIPEERITTVPIGIEHDDPAFLTAARVRSRKTLGVSDETVVIGNVARLVPFKGHRVLIESAALVVRARPEVVFLIIGNGELITELQNLARNRGVGDHIRFLGFRDDLQDLYPAFDVYCHSSLELAAEMFPIAILRALATHLPVVCTNVGGIAGMIIDGVSGFLVQPDDPRALAGALLKVFENPAMRTSMGEASFDHFLRHFHASAMAENVERVYQQL